MIKAKNILVAIYGISTAIAFLLMVAAGGLFNSVHTLFYREVSFIISPYSLTENITLPIYRIYNTLLLLFSLTLLLRFQNVFAKLGALYLSMSAVMSLFLISYPMDAIHLSKSLNGATHIFVSLIVALYAVVALQLFGYGFKSLKHLAILSRYSYIVSTTILLAGVTTAVLALFRMSEYVGVIQKLPMLAFLFWSVLTAIIMLRSDNRVHYFSTKKRRRKK